jgi:hypothetical protein
MNVSIDKSRYRDRVSLLNEQITLTELELYTRKLEELDLEAALNFAVSALSNAAAFWNRTKQRFSEFCCQFDSCSM